MTETLKELQNLISMTQQHLLQEYEKDDWIMIDQNNYNYFKKLAANYKPVNTQSPPQAKLQSIKPKPKPAPRKPSPQPKKKEPKTSLSQNFEKETLPEPKQADFQDVKKFIQQKFPHIEIIDSIPTTFEKKKETNTPVIILSYTNHPLEKSLLENIAKAISVTFKPTTVLNKLPDSLDTVEFVLDSVDNKYDNAIQIKMLAPSNYLKNPKKKQDLWKAICEHL